METSDTATPTRRRRRKSAARKRRRSRAKGSARRGLARAFKSSPRWLKVSVIASIVVAVAMVINGIYQVARKPTEVFTPMGTVWNKSPTETWRNYGSLFRKQATSTITPELLAALAQAEGAGNPMAHTYWRWSWSINPLHVYRPASSSVGMYQITDGTFAFARHYCIKNHQVRSEGAWDDWNSCWFNGLYFRVLPSDAIELTSAYLDVSVNDILARTHRTSATLEQKQRLASMIHLCGAGAADSFARHGFRTGDGQRCGDHDPAVYMARVSHLEAVFAGLSRET